MLHEYIKLLVEKQQRDKKSKRTLYHIGPRPAEPKPMSRPYEQAWRRYWIDQGVKSGVFLSPNPFDIAQYHGVDGNVYAYKIPEWVVSKAGGIHRYDHGSEILISSELWQEAGNEIEFLGKSMSQEALWDKIDSEGAERFGRKPGSRPGWMSDDEWERASANKTAQGHISGLRSTNHPENAVRMMKPHERIEALKAFETIENPEEKDFEIINLIKNYMNESMVRKYIRALLVEGRYESETTQISRAVVSWVKDKLAEGLPQGEVPKYKRGHPFHDLGIRMFDVPSTLKGQLNRLTATIKVDPDLNAMKDTFEVAGKAGISTSGSKDMQVQIYLRSDFTLQDMNDFIADLKETIIHELEHTGQSEELKDTAEPRGGRGYDWNKLDGLRNYYSSQSEMEAYAKGAFKKAKVKGIAYPEAIDEMLNSSMATFIRRYDAHADAGVADRLDYNEQDLRDYFQKELRDQILDIARRKYPKAHGLDEK